LRSNEVTEANVHENSAKKYMKAGDTLRSNEQYCIWKN
jgi:hypothetical protein